MANAKTDAKGKSTAAVNSEKQVASTNEIDKENEKLAEVVKTEAKPVAAAPVADKAEEKPKAVRGVRGARAAKTDKVPKTPKAAKTDKAAKAPKAAKPAAKRAYRTGAAKSEGKSGAVATNVVLQFAGKSYSLENLIASVKDVWVYDLGKEIKDFKFVDLYVKTEESRVYAVVNGLEQLDFAI